MRVSITGSRSISLSFADITQHLPVGTTTIISGGAVGVDTVAASYAREHGLELFVILPNYSSYPSTERSRSTAPLLRNTTIVSQSDFCLFFWDGVSRGTSHTISEARRLGKHGLVVVRGLISHSFRF
jgi:predicted Rossmann fold nucleotide-binding protein DprA/Smf involved in DNA uptake